MLLFLWATIRTLIPRRSESSHRRSTPHAGCSSQFIIDSSSALTPNPHCDPLGAMQEASSMTRRRFAAAAAAFTIVPRHVLGGPGQVAPSDRINLATIGLGRQGMAITMDLLARPDVQVVAVCDVNPGSKDYAEYGTNALLTSARRLLGAGYEKWGEDLASPGFAQLTN